MTESPQELAAVEQLLAEGDALRGWLGRLDGATSGVSETVRQRVRADYQQRLDHITAGLRAHSDIVNAKLNEDRAEHADLLARANQARDALAEAELRHAVGEYDGDRFQGEQRRFSSDIEAFDLSLGAAAERIARLEEVHALVERGPRAPVADVAEVNVTKVEAPEYPPVEIADLAPDAEEALAVFDEEFTGDQPPAATGNGPLSFRPSGGSGEWPRTASPPAVQPRPFDNAPPLGIPAAGAPPRFVRPGERFVPPAPPAPPAAVPAAVEAEPFTHRLGQGIEPPAPQAAAGDAGASPVGRTLRCGECGAMNRPLEWYCEKCGAELTAV